MQKRFPNLLFVTLIMTLMFGHATTAFAQENDNDLLDIMPAVIAATTTKDNDEPALTSLDQILKLSGRWRANRTSSDIDFEDFYRFLNSTAAAVEGGAGITGEAHIDQLFDFVLNEAIGIFVEDPEGWVIYDPWGPPNFDLGSLYVATTIQNQFSASHFFYIPSTLELSTGISSDTTFTKLSSSFKSKNSVALSAEERVNALVKEHSDQQAIQTKAKGATKSADVIIAERGLKILQSKQQQ